MTELEALLDAHQSTRLLRLSFPRNDGPQAKLMVNRFEGTEYLSRDFEFKGELLSDDARMELEAMHGTLLCVSLVQAVRLPGMSPRSSWSRRTVAYLVRLPERSIEDSGVIRPEPSLLNGGTETQETIKDNG